MASEGTKQHLDILIQDDMKYDIRIENSQINWYIHGILRNRPGKFLLTKPLVANSAGRVTKMMF